MARERTFRQITEQSRNLLRRIDDELREARANRDFQRFRTLTTRRRRVAETTERYRGNTTRLRGEIFDNVRRNGGSDSDAFRASHDTRIPVRLYRDGITTSNINPSSIQTTQGQTPTGGGSAGTRAGGGSGG